MGHDFDTGVDPQACSKCGITKAESTTLYFEGGPDGNWNTCTGNAYVCRVARAIRPIAKYWLSAQTDSAPVTT